LGRAFNDLPELPAYNNPKEARGGGAQLGGDDATNVAIANSAEDVGEDETTQHVDSSVK
jgi:hypothetical protein